MAAVIDYPITEKRTEEQQIRDLYRTLLEPLGTISLVGSGGESCEIPESVCLVFRNVLAKMQEGKSVTVVPLVQELTTKQAAGILGVSRQYLVRLLERDEIRYHKAGTHRRIYLTDLLAYRDRRDEARHEAIKRMAKQDIENGIYFAQPE